MTLTKDPAPHRGTLIVFSWGAPARLADLVAQNGSVPAHVVWVDPLGADAAPDAFAKDAAVMRIAAVLAPKRGDMELLRHSLPDLYSLTPATDEMRALFPGLKTRGDVPVTGMTAAALGKKLAAIESPVDVVIDTPGAEQRVLDFLASGKMADKIRRIVLRCGAEPFFEQGAGAPALLAGLEERGFEVVQTRDDDPDWPQYTLKLDLRARQISKMEAEVDKAQTAQAAARKQVRAQAKEIAARDKELETLRAELEAVQAVSAERTSALETTRAALEAQRAQVVAAQGASTHAAETEARLRAERTALNTELEGVYAQITAHEAKIAERDAMLAERDTVLSKTRAELEARSAQRDAAVSAARESAKTLETEATAHADARTGLTLARDEIRRAEGQIDLIKDLLLREPGF